MEGKEALIVRVFRLEKGKSEGRHGATGRRAFADVAPSGFRVYGLGFRRVQEDAQT